MRRERLDAWDTRSIQVPNASGEVVCVPPLRSWQRVAETNAARLERGDVLLDGEPLPAFRKAAQEEILAAAARFSNRIGIDAEIASGPLVVTGHQPVFYHPGIWAKTLVFGLCAGLRGLNLIVDSDEAERVDVAVPRRNGALRIRHHPLISCPPEVPFEAVPPPSLARWRAFVAALEEDLLTLDRPELLARLRRLRELGERVLRSCGSFGEFITALRRGFEPPPRYLELPVSSLSRTRAFLRFVRWMVASHERLWAAYNEALQAYRKTEGIRSAAQPFPDLRRHGDRYELPLWSVRSGRRRPVFAKREGQEVVLLEEESPLLRIGPESPPEALEGCELRPRALTLTLFVRVCLADLFVHGVGGAHYDRATDVVIRNFLQLDPPEFAVVTATFHLPLDPPEDPKTRRARLQQRLYELLHNPDRVYPPQDPQLRALAEEKWALIRRLQQENLTRRERRALTHRIRALNQELSAPLAQEIQRVREELAELGQQEAAYEAATHRGYPFFLFDGAELQAHLRARLFPGH